MQFMYVLLIQNNKSDLNFIRMSTNSQTKRIVCAFYKKKIYIVGDAFV